MAEYWPRVFMDLDFVSVHRHAKKERGQYPAVLTSRLVNKGFIIWDKTRKNDKFPLRDKTAILPARVANHSARFGSSYDVVKKESDALQGGSWRRGLGSEKL